MSRTVLCLKLGKECPGLDAPPMKGEFGQKVFDHISLEAWNEWLSKQTMLINENRLNMLFSDDRSLIMNEASMFLFGDQQSKGEE